MQTAQKWMVKRQKEPRERSRCILSRRNASKIIDMYVGRDEECKDAYP